MADYAKVFAESIDQPELFWAKAAEGIDWYKKYDSVLDGSNPPFYRWFSGGSLNTCYNAVDRHVGKRQGRSGCNNLRQPGHRYQNQGYLQGTPAKRLPDLPAVSSGWALPRATR